MRIVDQGLGCIISVLTTLHGGILWSSILTKAGCWNWISLLQSGFAEDLFLQRILS